MSSKFNIPKRKSRANTITASTPKRVKWSQSIPSCSISEIDAGSSSSDQRNVQLEKKDLTKKFKKGKEEKKKLKKRKNVKFSTSSDNEVISPKKQLIDDKFLNEKQKKLKEKHAVEKAKVSRNDTDSEWETENLILEESTSKKCSTHSQTSLSDERIRLFEDPCTSYPCTPEKIRDAIQVHSPFHTSGSPILSLYNRSAKRNDRILQSSKLLPVKSIEKEVPNSEQTTETVTVLHTVTNIQTLLQNFEKLDSSEEDPLETNNLQQDPSGRPIRTYSKYNPHKIKSKYPHNLKDFYKSLPALPKKEKFLIPPGMFCTVGTVCRNPSEDIEYTISGLPIKSKGNRRKTKSKNKDTKRCTRQQTNDVYDPFDVLDVEFETSGKNSERMSFRDFCNKLKIQEITESDSEDSEDSFLKIK